MNAKLCWTQAADLCSHGAIKPLCIKTVYLPDTASAGKQGFPRFRGAEPQRGDQSCAGNDDPVIHDYNMIQDAGYAMQQSDKSRGLLSEMTVYFDRGKCYTRFTLSFISSVVRGHEITNTKQPYV